MSLFASYCSRCGAPKTSSVLCVCQSSFRTSWPVRQGPTTLAALYHEKLAAKDAEIKRLKDDSPGTPLGRFKWISNWAYSQDWCSSISARAWETQLIEHVQALEKREAAYKAFVGADEELAEAEYRFFSSTDPQEPDSCEQLEKAKEKKKAAREKLTPEIK